MAKSNKKKAKQEEAEVLEKQAENIENESIENESTEQDDVRAEIESLNAQLEEKHNDYLRLMAEFDNFRKRTQREKAALIEYAGAEVVTALLPVLDDFERSMETMEKTDNLSSLKEGVVMIHDKFYNVLTKKGLTRIETEEADFDSELHEAIASVPAGEEKSGKVIDTVEKGYKLKERVIRYAKVIVGE